MTNLQITGLACATLVTFGCATQQTIGVETSPSGAAISVNSEYIGRSPAQVSLDDIKHIKTLRIDAEKAEYDTATKLIEKKSNGKFPGQVFLKLDPTSTSPLGGNGQVQGGQQTTIQGPTIVFPGMSPTPQVISPPQ